MAENRGPDAMQLEALRAHLAEGAAQAERGEFVDGLEELLAELNAEAPAPAKPK
jgi:hypothetical protein